MQVGLETPSKDEKKDKATERLHLLKGTTSHRDSGLFETEASNTNPFSLAGVDWTQETLELEPSHLRFDKYEERTLMFSLEFFTVLFAKKQRRVSVASGEEQVSEQARLCRKDGPEAWKGRSQQPQGS